MRTKKILTVLALLCAVVQGAWAQASWEEVYSLTGTSAANWTALDAGSSTGKTIGTAGTTTYYYAASNLTFTNSTAGGSGLTITGSVYLYVPEGVTVTCTGANGNGQTGGTPYIIKWASGEDIVSPVFNGVVIDKTDRGYDNEATGNLRVQFLGTYAPLPFNADNKSILFMGAENKLYYPESGASIGAQRAYFKIGDETAAPRLTAFNINFGDGETTGIVNISKESGSCRRMVHPRRAQTLAEAHRPRYIYQQWSKGRD